jgi:heavy metal translocating P-type ATPase
MVAATLAVFIVPLVGGDTLQRALLRAMTFMIVASPCAVVLATMPPLLAAIANAGRHGVLVKSAVVMEQLGTTTRVAFDKTGTLTRGTPELIDIYALPDSGFTKEQVLTLAAGAEHPSEHPLAAAIVRAAHARSLALPAVEEFHAHPGRGVTAHIGGRLVAVGSPAAVLTDPHTPDITTTASAIDHIQASGHTAIIISCDHRPIGVLAITDQLRPDAAAAVTAITQLTRSSPILLTGDNHAAAVQLAAQVGIHQINAELMPDDKVAAVTKLQDQGENITVVGDGINDAPALAAAHAGIAMGGAGSDLTLQTADAVIIRDDLTTIPTVIALSRKARRVVVANLAIAAAFIATLVVWDLVGTLPLPLGVAGHEGSTIIVGLNGLRILRQATWRRAATPAN